MFIKKIIFEREKVIDFEQYPFNIEIIKNLHELTITSPVTFLIGENEKSKKDKSPLRKVKPCKSLDVSPLRLNKKLTPVRLKKTNQNIRIKNINKFINNFNIKTIY